MDVKPVAFFSSIALILCIIIQHFTLIKLNEIEKSIPLPTPETEINTWGIIVFSIVVLMFPILFGLLIFFIFRIVKLLVNKISLLFTNNNSKNISFIKENKIIHEVPVSIDSIFNNESH